ncbi:MAG TPA: HAD-IB family phosphatase [Spirochaetota bacterium]|nr:HAD-IB family phosphatase [Spirochaetota bacterium]HPC40933.1 HAD-IB family phosphatase [Spirochaetota bacterium]HPL16060.1 HAD-IB family phosphatase [Spirochaetota bacterium]HQF08637.1 HAD-IB family phosphatase [Spirochaetota bacterium]HQH97352.1 HAD-IB family phosphatase [Spirochaetota bacterium]
MTSANHFKRAVFCDFDGTITSKESFVGMFNVFTPDLFRQVAPEMLSGRMTLKEAVRRLIESLPSDKYGEILDYVLTIDIRPGFTELLDYLESMGVPLVIISGGFRGMIETRLGPLLERVHAVHAVDVDTTGPFLRVLRTVEGDTELMAKAKVMALYDCGEAVAIGDGSTDHKMAEAASFVFARDGLMKYLRLKEMPFIQWDDFLDVRRVLMERWGGKP